MPVPASSQTLVRGIRPAKSVRQDLTGPKYPLPCPPTIGDIQPRILNASRNSEHILVTHDLARSVVGRRSPADPLSFRQKFTDMLRVRSRCKIPISPLGVDRSRQHGREHRPIRGIPPRAGLRVLAVKAALICTIRDAAQDSSKSAILRERARHGPSGSPTSPGGSDRFNSTASLKIQPIDMPPVFDRTKADLAHPARLRELCTTISRDSNRFAAKAGTIVRQDLFRRRDHRPGSWCP